MQKSGLSWAGRGEPSKAQTTAGRASAARARTWDGKRRTSGRSASLGSLASLAGPRGADTAVLGQQWRLQGTPAWDRLHGCRHQRLEEGTGQGAPRRFLQGGSVLGLGSLASGDAERRIGDASPEQGVSLARKLLLEAWGPRRRSGSASTPDGDPWRAAPSADSAGWSLPSAARPASAFLCAAFPDRTAQRPWLPHHPQRL